MAENLKAISFYRSDLLQSEYKRTENFPGTGNLKPEEEPMPKLILMREGGDPFPRKACRNKNV